VCHVRLLGVMRADGVAHPELVPPDLVHAVVVASAERGGGLVEIAMCLERPQRALSAGRPAVDADARQVHVRVLRRRGLDPRDAIREAGIAEVLAANIMKSL